MLLNPKDIKVLRELGLHYLKERNVERAFPLLLQAVAREPTDRTTLFGLAQIYFATDDLPAAIKTLRVLTQHHPDHVSGVNNLAWILATHPDDALRDGKEALRLALTLPVKTEASYADTLAAALAETGALVAAMGLAMTGHGFVKFGQLLRTIWHRPVLVGFCWAIVHLCPNILGTIVYMMGADMNKTVIQILVAGHTSIFHGWILSLTMTVVLLVLVLARTRASFSDTPTLSEA